MGITSTVEGERWYGAYRGNDGDSGGGVDLDVEIWVRHKV